MAQKEDTQLTGPGIGLTFLYYFSMTVIIVMFIGSRSDAFTFASPELRQYGTLAGLVAGIIGTIVNRNVTMAITFENRNRFQTRLNQKLAEIGFEPEELEDEITDNTADPEPEGEYLSYFRSGLAGQFAGGVYVLLSARSATISSRAINIRRIRKLL
ncbi:hypothetical protein [Acaryochloris sp. CCMEE 5410]|uniref:hypothetical protein n=1 Tax=Acaryochloris sp. CCMEE 5410 TaxID=310037 RepID=UPI0002484922|nr:hypothetical protein [Acaryochloris sp. CCMEE 5410]KAI9130999.1 hypothetical protein ON05_025265 [Acaryochloris sp. CCMEE 5410]